MLGLLLVCIIGHAGATCVQDIYYCNGGIDYVQANRIDCSRFVHCGMGKATYFQCRKNFVFDFCLQKCVFVNDEGRYECFNATNIECVIQKERPYDPSQAEAELPVVNPYNPLNPLNPGVPITDGTGVPINPVVPPVFPPVIPPIPIDLGNGLSLGQGLIDFGINLNYQPFYGWGFSTNFGIQTPYTPYTPYSPYGPMPMSYGGYRRYPYRRGPYAPYSQFPNNFNGYGPWPNTLNPIRTAAFNQAVRVTSCVPSDPWPSTPSITTTEATTIVPTTTTTSTTTTTTSAGVVPAIP